MSTPTDRAASPPIDSPPTFSPPTDSPLRPPNAHNPADTVPWGVRIAAEWSWRLLLLAAMAYVLKKTIGQIHLVLVPFLIALLLSALLAPAVRILHRWMPRGVAVAVVTVGGISVVIGVLTFVVQQVIDGASGLQDNLTASFDKIRDWLVNGPLGLSPDQIDNAIKAATAALTKNREALTSGALSTAGVVGEVITSMLLVFFSLIFLLKDGPKIWKFTLNFVPIGVRARVDIAGHRGFASLVAYIRATVIVAFVDALGIGIGLAVLHVPLALPLAAIVFLSSFIPIVGALISGTVAVAVTLVTVGPVQALIILGVVVAVQQLEGHVMQPFLMGRAVSLHPLAVVLSIAAGSVLGGIFGALLAVPTVAVTNAMVRSFHADTMRLRADEIDATSTDEASPPDASQPDIPAIDTVDEEL